MAATGGAVRGIFLKHSGSLCQISQRVKQEAVHHSRVKVPMQQKNCRKPQVYKTNSFRVRQLNLVQQEKQNFHEKNRTQKPQRLIGLHHAGPKKVPENHLQRHPLTEKRPAETE